MPYHAKKRLREIMQNWVVRLQRQHNVQLIDEFDLIEHSLRPFRAFSPASFRDRADKAASTPNTWAIRVHAGRMIRQGEFGHHERAEGIVNMCQRFKHELPDMVIGYNHHDGARVNLGWEERMRLEDHIEKGEFEEYDPQDKEMLPKASSPPPGWGIPQTCEPNSAMRNASFEFGDPRMDATGLEKSAVPEGSAGTLVESFKGYFDTCNSPQYRHFHSSTSWAYRE